MQSGCDENGSYRRKIYLFFHTQFVKTGEVAADSKIHGDFVVH